MARSGALLVSPLIATDQIDESRDQRLKYPDGDPSDGFVIRASAPTIGSSSATRKVNVAIQFSTELEAVQCLNGLLEVGRL